MDRVSLAQNIYNVSHLTGEFLLRSGQISHEYFDKYLFESQPDILKEIASSMSTLVPKETEVLAGLEMGGIPITTAMSMNSSLPACFVRKEAKKYGTSKFAEGADIVNKRVCVIEDVVTTGGQIVLSVADLRKSGAIIDTVLCVILRDERANEILAKEGLKLIPLFTMDYIKSVMKAI